LQAYFLAKFSLQPASSTTFLELYGCADNVADFVQDSNNWSSPVLPTPAGCPALKSNSEEFNDEGKAWLCV
jgi:hypothetical protein